MGKFIMGMLLCAYSACVYAAEQTWIEQELAGDDGPMSEEYSYSPEEEESPAESIIRSLYPIKPAAFSSELTFRNRQENDGSGFETDYWYNRLVMKMNWGSMKSDMGCIALKRAHEPAITKNSFLKYHLKKAWLRIADMPGNNTFIAGNYKAQYGQGLVFYGSLLEFSRPTVCPSQGLYVERGTNTNAYLNGCGWEHIGKKISYAAFLSRAWLSGDLDENGSADEDLYTLKNKVEKKDMEWKNFYEDLAGMHCSVHPVEGMTIGFSGYEAYYSRMINPVDTEDKYTHVFRGNRSTVGGVAYQYTKDVFSLSGEYAQSRSRGNKFETQAGFAWATTPQITYPPWNYFLTFYDYSPYYYSRHAKGPSFDNNNPNNQKGYVGGIRFKRKPHMLFVSYRTTRTPLSAWSGSAQSTAPRYPATLEEIYAEYSMSLTKHLETGIRLWQDVRDRYIDTEPSDAYYFYQTQQMRKRIRNDMRWVPCRQLRCGMRYEQRVEEIPFIGERLKGDLIYGEIYYKPDDSLSVGFRQTFFDSGGTYLSQYEPVWYGIHQSENFYNQEGMRSFVVLRYHRHDLISWWIRYGSIEHSDGIISQDLRFQIDIGI